VCVCVCVCVCCKENNVAQGDARRAHG
jgi:hypothetical protein